MEEGGKGDQMDDFHTSAGSSTKSVNIVKVNE